MACVRIRKKDHLFSFTKSLQSCILCNVQDKLGDVALSRETQSAQERPCKYHMTVLNPIRHMQTMILKEQLPSKGA